MILCRLIAPKWLIMQDPSKQGVIEGLFSSDDIFEYNAQGYNVYSPPNQPKHYLPGTTLNGSHIDKFDWVFVDFDLKSGPYKSKEEFLAQLRLFKLPPTKVIDSGNGIHAYWKVSDLDAMSYLRLQRRLSRQLHTDTAVCQIMQLMRLPETINTKVKDNFILCEALISNQLTYSCEELDRALLPITIEDEKTALDHYNRTLGIDQGIDKISDVLPPRFGQLLSSSAEAKELWIGNTSDRSKNDYRLGHILFGNGFTRDEAASVLINSAKALERAPIHRYNYAKNIIDKIWTFETLSPAGKLTTSPTVRELLSRGEDTNAGERFPCHILIDDTVHGFRLGQVIGIIGGSGVGKTTLTLNTFLWFAERNPNFHHFFFSLEQPAGEIANRIRTICGDNDSLYDRIHIVSNYTDTGDFIHFSIDQIEKHLLEFQEKTQQKVGAAVIDHIGVLAKSEKNGENDGLIGICRRMKAVAVKINIVLIMLSQAPREKAGVGDLELDKSSAYGTVFFESFLDYCICLWQPLKRVYHMGAPTVMAFKFAKIRHKKQGQDVIKEDICYQLFFDPKTERLRELTQAEEVAAKFYVGTATSLRKADRKTDIVTYDSRRVDNQGDACANTPGFKSRSNIQ